MKTVKMVPISEYVSLKMEVDRLQAMVAELEQNLQAARQQSTQSQLDQGVLIWSDGINRFVKVRDIAMIEAESNYSVIHLTNGEHIFTARTMKHWSEKINSPYLLRVHKSFLVNYRNILSLEQKSRTILLYGGKKAKYTRGTKSLLTKFL
ncbi:MAG: LytTR family transcriptional regulator DNA-binding domain-containing protein [Saprospiraceae bacterium]|nr:LytTR family transcriptional regulator DNA-binding domain-containing protein [Saprospiraceae bacterium]